MTWPRKLLLPLAPAYRLALWLRSMRLGTRFEPVHRLRFPVISIGNLSTGGAGKTPLTIALAQALARRSIDVDVLSRGYGRIDRGAVRVAPDGKAQEFGDEPLLVAQSARVPVYVASQRYDAGLLAESSVPPDDEKSRGSRVHLLDDGFQHRQLDRAIDILLLDRRDWTDSLLPAGNLREPVKAIHRASVVAIPANDPEFEQQLRHWGWGGPIWRLIRRMEMPPLPGPVAAFCGIARPEQFFDGLVARRVPLVLSRAFPDHYKYSAEDTGKLLADARAAGALALLTTEKDLVRLGELAAGFPRFPSLKTVRLHVEIENEDAAMEWLIGRLNEHELLCEKI